MVVIHQLLLVCIAAAVAAQVAKDAAAVGYWIQVL